MKALKAKKQDLKSAYNLIDVDGDNKLVPDELRHGFESLKIFLD